MMTDTPDIIALKLAVADTALEYYNNKEDVNKVDKALWALKAALEAQLKPKLLEVPEKYKHHKFHWLMDFNGYPIIASKDSFSGFWCIDDKYYSKEGAGKTDYTYDRPCIYPLPELTTTEENKACREALGFTNNYHGCLPLTTTDAFMKGWAAAFEFQRKRERGE